MTNSSITLYRVETACHGGPFHGVGFDERESNIIIETHVAPCDMELYDEAYYAIASTNFLYFFSDFETLAEVFTLKKNSIFRVIEVVVPLSLEMDKMFQLQGYQVIFDSDTYLNYVEQGKVIVRDDLTEQITE